jgi:limonene-1,2-epoxide hydrolase
MRTPDEPVAVVETFLTLLADRRAEEALALLSPDVEWRNTGLPTLRGARAINALRQMERRNITFHADTHHIAGTTSSTAGAVESVVLTDRTDFLGYGRFEASFWVCGTFTVREGRITVWSDHFAGGNVVVGMIRGLIGLVSR